VTSRLTPFPLHRMIGASRPGQTHLGGTGYGRSSGAVRPLESSWRGRGAGRGAGPPPNQVAAEPRRVSLRPNASRAARSLEGDRPLSHNRGPNFFQFLVCLIQQQDGATVKNTHGESLCSFSFDRHHPILPCGLSVRLNNFTATCAGHFRGRCHAPHSFF